MYRGVSKNGPKWQVLFMAHNQKQYMGSIESEEQAARAYDELAIRAHGFKVNL